MPDAFPYPDEAIFLISDAFPYSDEAMSFPVNICSVRWQLRSKRSYCQHATLAKNT